MNEEDLSGHMDGEDQGDAPECPYCGSETECAHLLAVFDWTFGYCWEGTGKDFIDACADRIREVFLIYLQSDSVPSFGWKHELMDELWQYAKESYKAEDAWVEVDKTLLMRLLGELFGEADGGEYEWIEPGGPGQTSVLSLYYAADPKAVYAKASGILDVRLKETTTAG